MKRLYFLLAAGTCLGLFSCNITDIAPKDSLTDESYWTKPEDLKLYANKLYENLPAPEHLDNTSDNFVTTNYSSLLFNESNVPTNNSGSYWGWTVIRACNFFLTRYQSVQGTEEEINQYVAEVRFFRAYDYFGKIKRYGDIPFFDRDLQTSDVDLLYKARDPRDLVLGKIIEDLEFAVQWLPEPNRAEAGRLHKYAALTQLARVYLHEGTRKKYHGVPSGSLSSEQLLRKAAQTAETIMNSGLYDIVRGDDTGCGQVPFEGYPLYYCNLFVQESLIGNPECILPRIYVVDVVMHGLSRSAGGSGTGFSKDFVESFLCKDGKPVGSSPLYRGDETLETELTDRDPRMYQLIDNLHRPAIVMNGERQVNPYTNVAPSGAVTGYPCMKFSSPLQAQHEANKTTYDWFIYRYAEVLLIYAEAKAELGECTQDVLDKTVNRLRDRVEMPHLTVSPEVDPNPVNYGYEISPLLYEIRRERRIELIAEGFRWDDIIRWKAGKLLENPKTFLGMRVTSQIAAIYPEGTFYGETGVQTATYENKELIKPYTGKSLDEAGRKWTDNDKRYLEPIPLEELTLNSNLTQNPGW
ncbi:MAG: RagB/SusD family nutrient uptake outer membrane protein [Tannerella sp.]|jgi:hypothetical protein|nr:RagB/SusD family nutrient uptake outer membrane protein [Tannerella sp.]